MAKPSKISDVSLPQGQSILNKVISGYERRNLAGKISKNRHLCLAEVKGKREGKGPWGSRSAEIRKSSAIISAPGAPRDLNHPSVDATGPTNPHTHLRLQRTHVSAPGDSALMERPRFRSGSLFV